MTKRIVIFAGGTWIRRLDASDPECTNVFRICEFLEDQDQVGIAINGIGVINQIGIGGIYERGTWSKLKAAATGYGITAKIENLYASLVDHYAPGDLIYMFGFSRGAYLLRSLAGMINACGIVRKEGKHEHAKKSEAFRCYKKGNEDQQKAFREKHSYPPATIQMLGLFDTVKALGLPWAWVENLNPFDSNFHQIEINPLIRTVYHALAIDENRESFLPTPFDKDRKNDDQILEEVWFSGSHSDVGGGFRSRGLADISLAWMIRNAKDQGLRFKEETSSSLRENAFEDPLHDPRKRLWWLYTRATRDIEKSKNTLVAETVQQRARSLTVGPEYSPINLADPKNLSENYRVVPVDRVRAVTADRPE